MTSPKRLRFRGFPTTLGHRMTMMPDPIRVLLWGDPTPDEMRPLALHLLTLPVAIIPCPDMLGIDRAAFPFDDEPDLVVALQSWPDEFPRTLVERALARFPLARWVCCYGEWCASDGRSRDIWPPGARVALASAPSRIARELEVIRGDLSPLPPTASRDEVFAFELPRADPQEAIRDRFNKRPRAIRA